MADPVLLFLELYAPTFSYPLCDVVKVTKQCGRPELRLDKKQNHRKGEPAELSCTSAAAKPTQQKRHVWDIADLKQNRSEM